MLVKENKKFNLLNKDCHKYDTRSANDYHRVSTNKTRTNKDPYKIGVILYNKLPVAIKNVKDSKFKAAVKSLLIDKCLYNITEL